jgi:hypothetical protein
MLNGPPLSQLKAVAANGRNAWGNRQNPAEGGSASTFLEAVLSGGCAARAACALHQPLVARRVDSEA